MTRSEIQKLARVKYDSPSEKIFFLGCINRKGLFGISENRSRTWYIKFVDTSDENIIEYVTDYEHLALYYEKLMGTHIGQCKYCGALFRQNKYKDALYCYKHRGRIKKDIQPTRVCESCGVAFPVTSRTKRTLCESCYKKNRYKKMKECRKAAMSKV